MAKESAPVNPDEIAQMIEEVVEEREANRAAGKKPAGDAVSINDIVGSAANVARKLYNEQAEKFNPEQVDQDIIALIRGEYVHREFVLGGSVKVVLRDLKARDYRICRVLAMQMDEKGEVKRDPETSQPIVDPAQEGLFEIAAGIESISNSELPVMPVLTTDDQPKPELLELYRDAIWKRYRWLMEIAPSSFKLRLMEETKKFYDYLQKLGEPRVISNF